MPIYQPKDVPRCPNPDCDEEMENPAEDYIIPGRVGIQSESTDRCGYCDEWFSCERLPDGTIDFELVEDSDD